MNVVCRVAIGLLLMSASALFAACGAPDLVCDLRDGNLSTTRKVDTRVTGLLSLPPGNVEQRVRLSIQVAGLSELGTSHARGDSSYVSVARTLSYGPGVPAGAELPDVELKIGVVLSDGVRAATSSSTRIFSCNGSKEDGCCELGEPECSTEVELAFARNDALFPEVQVEWTALVHAGFTGCEGDGPLGLDVQVMER